MLAKSIHINMFATCAFCVRRINILYIKTYFLFAIGSAAFLKLLLSEIELYYLFFTKKNHKTLIYFYTEE